MVNLEELDLGGCNLLGVLGVRVACSIHLAWHPPKGSSVAATCRVCGSQFAVQQPAIRGLRMLRTRGKASCTALAAHATADRVASPRVPSQHTCVVGFPPAAPKTCRPLCSCFASLTLAALALSSPLSHRRPSCCNDPPCRRPFLPIAAHQPDHSLSGQLVCLPSLVDADVGGQTELPGVGVAPCSAAG